MSHQPQAPWYAKNARNLLDLRRAGMKPEGPVNVSLIGPLDSNGLTLFVGENMPVERLDWRMLVNLDVIVWADSSVPFERVSGVVLAIAKTARPAELQLCFHHREHWHLIDCGSGLHLPKVAETPAHHSFFWQPINAGSTPVGTRLVAAISKTQQPGVTL